MSEEKITQTEKVPRILLEILVHGVEKDKKRIHECLTDINSQMQKSRSNKHKARILWYIDKGELTQEEKEKWLIENSNCKYYCFIEPLAGVGKKFVSETLSKIRALENSIKSVKAANIMISKKKPEPDIEEAKIIEMSTNKKEG